MLRVHEMCKREFQWKEAIPKSGKLIVHAYMHIVHYAKMLRGICAKLQVLYGTLLGGGQGVGQSKYGQNHMGVC